MVVMNAPSVSSVVPKCCMILAAAAALIVEPMGLGKMADGLALVFHQARQRMTGVDYCIGNLREQCGQGHNDDGRCLPGRRPVQRVLWVVGAVKVHNVWIPQSLSFRDTLLPFLDPLKGQAFDIGVVPGRGIVGLVYGLEFGHLDRRRWRSEE